MVRLLATKAHRLLGPLVGKFAAFEKKLSKAQDAHSLDDDMVATFDSSKALLTEWHGQSAQCLGKIAKGDPRRANELGFGNDKLLSEQIKNMKEIRSAHGSPQKSRKAIGQVSRHEDQKKRFLFSKKWKHSLILLNILVADHPQAFQFEACVSRCALKKKKRR